MPRLSFRSVLLLASLCFGSVLPLRLAGQALVGPPIFGTTIAPANSEASPESTLPDAPTPQTRSMIAMASSAGEPQITQQEPSIQPGFPPVSPTPHPQPSGSSRQHPEIPSQATLCPSDMSTEQSADISCAPGSNPYQRFLDSTGPHPLTPRQKGMLAVRNVLDPFNFLTIAGESGLSVAADSHSPYGPAWGGFGYSVGVAYTETVIGSFFGTFLIPSIAHQDPHYHREPNASVQRRVAHVISAVVWAQSDAGTGMVNYANIGSTALGDALGNLYIPGRQKSWGAGVSRFATALASDPIDNFITEFLPDVAKHVNVQIVIIQRVVNEVERQNGGG